MINYNQYFNSSEFDSPDMPDSGVNMDLDFIMKLTAARKLAAVPFKINSGFRSPKHNKKVGGKTSSSHLKGLAADISCKDDSLRATIIAALIVAGFNRIGIDKTFIHVDSDTSKNAFRFWVY